MSAAGALKPYIVLAAGPVARLSLFAAMMAFIQANFLPELE